jgi:hypothetical protein
METTAVVLIATLSVTTISGILVAMRKNIKRSTCCGSDVEFREPEGTGEAAAKEEPKVDIPNQPPNETSPSIIQISVV